MHTAEQRPSKKEVTSPVSTLRIKDDKDDKRHKIQRPIRVGNKSLRNMETLEHLRMTDLETIQNFKEFIFWDITPCSPMKVGRSFGRCLKMLAARFTMDSCLAYSSTLKMEATCSSEMSVAFQRTTRRYIPEDRTLHNHRCENLKSYKSKFRLGRKDAQIKFGECVLPFTPEYSRPISKNGSLINT
jgi:hypothetical protein